MKVGDFVVERLHAWGVRRIYGYPGDGINGVTGALQRADKIEFIQARHEEMAAFMAVAHAKFTGELGVCFSTGGPGATHMITGLYDAKLDHVPVLAICGQAEATVRGASYQQELNLDRMFADVAGFAQEASASAQVRHLIDRSIRVALARNCPSVLIFPKDIQDQDYEEPAVAHGFTRSGVGYRRPKIVPEDAELARAAEILNAGSKVAILIGAGARGAAPQLVELAQLLGCESAAWQGRAVRRFAVRHRRDRAAWHRTELGPYARVRHAADDRNRLSLGRIPAQGRQRPRVQIDIDASMLSLRYPADVNLHGDAATTLNALIPLLKRKEDRSWSKTIEANIASWWEKLEGRAMADASPVNPQRVIWEMSPVLPADAIITSDSGSCANWFARDYRVQRGQLASLSGGLASMGAAVPYAIGAKFAHPDRPVIALVGDGAMQMNNMAELITVQKYWKRWTDPRWIVCVFNNQDLNEVTWEQRVMEGNPKFEASQDIPDFPYSKFGEMLGFKGIFVDSPDRLASAWQEALISDRPVVIEVKTDPEVVPLPPHVTLQQARGFMSSMIKGDEATGHIISETAKQVFGGLFGTKEEPKQNTDNRS